MKPTTEELKALLDKVTPGEWGVKTGVYVDKDSCIVFANDGDIDRHIADCGVPKTNENESNAKLIKLAPSLAREVIELREAKRELLAALEGAYKAGIIAYAAAYCGNQPWTSERREELRLYHCHADMLACAALAKHGENNP